MAEKVSPTVDKSFKLYMEEFISNGYTLLSAILGYDLGLFDLLKAAEKPLTASTLADLSGCKERYIQEWVNAMSAAKIISVEIDNDDNTLFYLSEECYDSVISTATYGKGIFEFYARLEVTKNIFRKEGPLGDHNVFNTVSWDFFEEFREKTSKVVLRQHVFPNIEKIPSLKQLLETGCLMLDVGCGTGDITLHFAERYPRSTFVGIDMSERSLEKARHKLTTMQDITNVRFQRGSINNLEEGIAYNVIFCSEFLHNLPDPMLALECINKALGVKGRLIMIEPSLKSDAATTVGNMEAAYLYAVNQFCCLPFSMSASPAVGYGASWKEEDMLSCVEKFASLDEKFVGIHYSSSLYVFTKK